ncbi:MAG: hypothetical protein JOY58_05100, partial [Solirubrobacterales bacterium]|nr:hypothetical protein [Solirubrobacterales bacterium]
MTIVAGTGTSPALAGCGEADQRRERVQPPRIGDGLTTTLWVMAFVALANIVITCVRIASAHPDRLSWLRLSLELAVGGVLFACAWRRLRSRRQNAAGSVQAPHMPAIEATEQPPALSTAVRSKWMRRARRLLTPALLVVAALTVT